MSPKKFLIVVLGLSAMLSFFTGPLLAVPGDCDGSGTINIGDITSIVAYLQGTLEIPMNPEDCDCDGNQGITIGDAYQIVYYYYFGGGTLYPPWGDDFVQPCGVEFYYNERINFDDDHSVDTIRVSVNVPDDFEVQGLSIPFSFAAEDGAGEVNCDNVDFTGSVGTGMQAGIDNDAKAILISGDFSTVPLLAAGSKGLLFTAYFSQVNEGPAITLRMAKYKRYWPLVFRWMGYGGVDGLRIFFPAVIDTPYGDANCDGLVNVSDAVWIINYIFIGGAAPGDC